MSARGVLRIVEGNGLSFYCPGCESRHHVQIAPASPAWGFNGDYDRPTFTPSVLVQGFKRVTDETGEWDGRWEKDAAGNPIPFVCHSCVRDGKIQFLSDCTHWLAGQTVDLKRQEREES